MPTGNDSARRQPRSRADGARTSSAVAAKRQEIERQARQRVTLAIAVAVVVVVAIGIALAVTLPGGHKKATAAGGQSSAAASTALALAGTGSTPCTYSASGQAARDVGQPPAKGVAAGTYKATLSTSQGAVVVDLDGAKAPCTVNSFVYLAAKHYFDGTNCHRLTTAGIFVLQCGDPTGTGAGGPGYRFADENLAGATYPAGTVAMANAGPGTNGSQFFLVYKDTQLPPNYTPFGRIVSGLDVLTAVAAKGSDDSNGPGDGKPLLPIKIDSIAIVRGS